MIDAYLKNNPMEEPKNTEKVVEFTDQTTDTEFPEFTTQEPVWGATRGKRFRFLSNTQIKNLSTRPIEKKEKELMGKEDKKKKIYIKRKASS
jgi:hypothetical protein